MLRLLGLLVVTTLLAFGSAPSYPRWSWPVRGAHTIVRPFIAPATKYSAGHRGIDIAARGEIVAPADGVVHFSGVVAGTPAVSIDQGGDILSSFEPVKSSLKRGEQVTRGEVIGHVEAGHCAELCLHFGVRIKGQYVNPMLFLGAVVRPVLLPTAHLGSSQSRP
jgi:murein DD-endopeptidase MepM/ murein hydrolase activator NlpD